MSGLDKIVIRGASTHNLKAINLDLPKNALIVITGLSGCGKSSLAFDTLYAEGQRRYVESLSSYARQFLDQLPRPTVDFITGISPAIAIEQHSASHNPRSTVGTITEIYDYLRLLFAKAGSVFCPTHKLLLQAHSVGNITDIIMELPESTKIVILAPIKVQSTVEELSKIAQLGFTKIFIKDSIIDIAIAINNPQSITNDYFSIVIDRLNIKTSNMSRLLDSLETALKYGYGKVIVLDSTTNKEHVFSIDFACAHCNYKLDQLEPRLFSFNSPLGACRTCTGLGYVVSFSIAKVIVSEQLSIKSGAITHLTTPAMLRQVNILLKKLGEGSIATPWQDLSAVVQELILYGDSEFEGAIPQMERIYQETNSIAVKDWLHNYQDIAVCSTCNGTRICDEARNVLLVDDNHNYNFSDVAALSIKQGITYFTMLQLKGTKQEIAAKIVAEISNRLQFLQDVGLDYLSLNRTADTLSGGEAQRIRLASQIGSGLTGVMYVLDEPSIGLHQRDNDRLIASLMHLRDLGNTVILVEHDQDTILQADYVVDIGPAAGEQGGEVMYAGQVAGLLACNTSLTGQYLSKNQTISMPTARRSQQHGFLEILGATGNNLKNVDVRLPIGNLICITGVSGSGKSTLINDTLLPIMSNHINHSNNNTAPYKSCSGLAAFDRVIAVDQSPIGRSPRSNPATYTGLLGNIRNIMSSVPLARERGYAAGRFSFNVKGGRCESCQGDGLIKIDMHFLADIYVECDSCHGKRYNRETLEICYKGKNIHDILSMTVDTALAFFAAIPAIVRKLDTLSAVGLSYIRLGQSATTLSGGEAQRIKLALELSKRDTGRTMYVLDEPTTGLHFHDIKMLLAVLQKLSMQGNTVVIIEHHLDVIKTADWVIDLGPEGGSEGGTIIATGTPEDIANNTNSHTGRYLKKYLVK